MNKSIFRVVLLLIVSMNSLLSQKGPEAGVWLGAGTYYGDLKTRVNLSDLGLAGGANFRYNFN